MLSLILEFRNIISNGPQYRFTSKIDFQNRSREIVASLNDFSNRWCKRTSVDSDALKEWKINILRLVIIAFHFTLIIQSKEEGKGKSFTP